MGGEVPFVSHRGLCLTGTMYVWGATLNPVILGLAPKRDGAEAVEKTHFSHVLIGQQPFISGFLLMHCCIRVTVPKPYLN